MKLNGIEAAQSRRTLLLATASCLAAFAFSSAPAVALAEGAAASDNGAGQLAEVVVTASRRSESVTKLPFNITAVPADQVARSGITSVAALSSQVPNFVVQDQGAGKSAQSIPIIRGLNASGATGGAARYFQSPVGLYQDNAPIVGSLPLMDLERIEVLRGPQGTLYGAGALGGALRVVPAAPKLGRYDGFFTAEASRYAHSDDTGYDFTGAINIPLGDTVAVRITAKREHDAGYIDVHDVFVRQNNDYVSGVPVLANPADVAGSKGVYEDKKDANVAMTTAVRGQILWEPTSKTKVQGSYSYAKVDGQGSPTDGYTYQGGPSPIDPRVTLRPTGEWEVSSPSLEPFNRESHLATLDASYDMGFATLATTIAYGRTRGFNERDATRDLLGTPFAFYYTGSPANPRTVVPVTNTDAEDSYTEEVRLVSAKGGRFDYVVGAFFEQNTRDIGLNVYDPGADAQTAAAHGGDTTPQGLGGTYIPVASDGSVQRGDTLQHFKDESIYGNLTFHITDRWQVTGGARVFHQTFNQLLVLENSSFFLDLNDYNATSLTKPVFLANTSYQLDSRNQFYATFSQGFRRGGANAFPTAGPVEESPQLLTYQPDKTNNFEAGFKGYIYGLRYAADVFYIQWKKPQIDLTTPYTLTYVVVNGNEAESKGFEFELAGPIGPKGMSVNLGLAYARARLTKDFSLPAGSGGGSIIPDAITGNAGDRLPGAPDFSASATLNYELALAEGNSVLFSGGVDYRSSTVGGLPVPGRPDPLFTAPGYALLRGSISYRTGKWELEVFGNNLADTHAVLGGTSRTASSIALLGGWGDTYLVTPPRQVGLRVTRRW